MKYIKEISVYNNCVYELERKINGYTHVCEVCDELNNDVEVYLGTIVDHRFISSDKGFYFSFDDKYELSQEVLESSDIVNLPLYS